MAFLPGEFQDYVNHYDWTQAEIVTYITAFYLETAMYCILVVLALRNIWVILVKLREYKNLPILAFYISALVTISLRLFYLLGYWTFNSVFYNTDWIQQAAKLCVGIV